MKNVPTLVCIAAALWLSACAGPAPKAAAISAEAQRSINVTQVTVDVAPIGAASQGRVLSARQIEAAVQKAANDVLVGVGRGNRRSRLHIEIESVNILSAGQAFMIGGESVMEGRVTIRDIQSGAVLMPPTKVSSGGGGWVPGGLIAVATLDEPEVELRQLSQEFAARIWTLVEGPTMAPGAVAQKPVGAATQRALPKKCQNDANRDSPQCKPYFAE
ncbi:hypothetical protein OEZ71_07290 [Defluviimonas sp. WL0050]|uniref:DUF4410 domain-containing protein n=1 Tax=Albidovulum litorale TaxID=2984134 RepID=A0ABT2ZLV4_9RHOB|nr:hypothetical protein [Defluviimonas sp. WL0050]